MEFTAIAAAVQADRFRVTDHADEEAQSDGLLLEEIIHSVIEGEIIEDYPADRPYPSCLIYGNTPAGEPVHSVWAYNDDIQWAVLITVYRPDPARWVDWRERK